MFDAMLRMTVAPLLLAATVAPLAAQGTVRNTLTGLPGVRLVVEDIPLDAERDGMTTNGIRTQVELLLGRAGITILDLETWNKTPGKPLLRVAFVAVKNQLGTYGYNLDVQLFQTVQLSRQPSFSVDSATWQVPTMVHLVNVEGLRDNLRQDVEDKVGAFVSSFLAANPASRPGQR